MVFCVISKVAQQVLPKGGTFGTSGPPACWDFPLEFTFRCLHRASDSWCRGFKRVFLFCFSSIYLSSTCCGQISVHNSSTCSTPVEITPRCINFTSFYVSPFQAGKTAFKPVRGKSSLVLSDLSHYGFAPFSITLFFDIFPSFK